MSFDDLHCEYMSASGSSYDDCAWIARRWRDAYGTRLSDSDFLTCDITNDEVRWWGPTVNICPMLWRALPSKRTYLADGSRGSLFVWDDLSRADLPAREVELTFAPEGVWGLDDEHVYTFGIGRGATPSQQAPAFARYDGKTVHGLPAPDFYITRLHGLAPDLIYAAGRGGMARWDGRTWHELPVPTDEVLSDVCVAGPDEIYATGHAGSLLEGTAKGLSIITTTRHERIPYACVTKFADQLFVGGASLGLFRRVGTTNELELIKPDIHATYFEARGGSLIITHPDEIIGTSDGENFFGAAFETVLNGTRALDIKER